ncbi:hypothetical protein SDC9_116234 [bioreactor metagenome]|uniref:Uncharacterized protein n=1 Tax=bioreactor metagenome TaxID=1076179 RepID=A0A645BV20_9ZZZZ
MADIIILISIMNFASVFIVTPLKIIKISERIKRNVSAVAVKNCFVFAPEGLFLIIKRHSNDKMNIPVISIKIAKGIDENPFVQYISFYFNAYF